MICFGISCILLFIPLQSYSEEQDSFISLLFLQTIEGPSSGLYRPEGVLFSESSGCIVVANQDANTVTFYAKDASSNTRYETSPCFTLGGIETLLDGPHDLSLSQNESHLAIANTRLNAITIYKKNSDDRFYGTHPIAIIPR